ncbi:MAG: hypothetical protein VX246_16760 [Myxococcota bacterium]|nr:hypothetical protein [Myxococcota bacterium]
MGSAPTVPSSGASSGRRQWLTFAWVGVIALAVGVRGWNALFGPMLWGYDAWAHITYVLFLDTFHALPWADQGWSFFHPPLYYLVGLGLAQFGSAEALAHGLACLSSLASVGIAWLVARVATSEGNPAALVAFCALAFLPVHLYVSPMPGNEMLGAFFCTASLAAFIANQRRPQQSVWLDAATAVLGALALLSKYSGALALGCVGVVALIQALRSPSTGPASRGAELKKLGARVAMIAAIVLLVAGPYYARNLSEFGTPFQTSHDVAKVKAVEASQAPGERGLRDYVSFLTPSVFENSNFDSPELLRSVWGTLYLNIWFDTFRAGQIPRLVDSPGAPREYSIHRWTVGMALVGLFPTLIVLFGGARSARMAWKDPTAIVDVVCWVLLVAGLTAFVLFSIRVPTFAAVKASYLLNLSLVWGWFFVRGVQGVAQRSSGAVLRLVAVGGAVVPLVCAGVFTSGLFIPMSHDNPDMRVLHSYFGVGPSALERARVPERDGSRAAVEVLASLEMSHGYPTRAMKLWHLISNGAQTPQFVNALAASVALGGNHRQGLRLWNQLLAAGGRRAMPEAKSNRAAALALEGRFAEAREDVAAALAAIPDLVAAWRNSAAIESLAGNKEAAAAAAARAAALETGAPRSFPHGVGDGELGHAVTGQRWLVVLRPDRKLELYRPPRSRIVEAAE